MSMDKIKWGILGLGNIAKTFAKDFQYTNGGIIVAAASRSIEKAKKFCGEYDIEKAYGTYQELIEDKGIDVIYIATPHNLHFQNTLDAIRAGKAVLCEKPITTNPNDLKVLIEEAKTHNTYLMEAMWTYFLPSIKKAIEWIRDGRIGTLKMIKADFAFKAEDDPNGRLFNPELAGGALLDIGIYPIAMSLLLTRKEPNSMHIISKKAKTGVDMAETMIFEYDDGLTANLYAALDHDAPWDALIIGTEGYVKIPDFFMSSKCFLYQDKKVVDHFVDQRKATGYNYEIDAVHQDLWSGKLESNLMPLKTSLILQNIMNKVMLNF